MKKNYLHPNVCAMQTCARVLVVKSRLAAFAVHHCLYPLAPGGFQRVHLWGDNMCHCQYPPWKNPSRTVKYLCV